MKVFLRHTAEPGSMERIKMVRLSLFKTRNYTLRSLTFRTMSLSSFTGFGDAVQPDGTLKDASEIVWTYDDDESIPFPSEGSASDPPSSSTTMHAPATVVAAVRRTTRISRPSRRVLEELEAAELASSAPASSGVKRKAASTLHRTTLPNHRATHKVVDVVSDGDSDDGTPSHPPTELASDDYESLQAMADADHQVCVYSLSFPPRSHLNPRLQPPKPGRLVLLMYASFSTARRNISIRSLGRLWMVTGAKFVGNCTFPLSLLSH